MAMAIFSIISVATVGMVFSSFSLRDQTLATTRTIEALRVFNRSLRQAALMARTVSGGGSFIFLSSGNQCWSFVFDSVSQNIRYSDIVSPGCIVDPNPSNNFFQGTTKIKSFSIVLLPIAAGGYTIEVSGVIQTVLPFASYEKAFSGSFTNVIDPS